MHSVWIYFYTYEDQVTKDRQVKKKDKMAGFWLEIEFRVEVEIMLWFRLD